MCYMLGGSYRLFRIGGIPIGIHPSLLIFLFLLLIWLADDYGAITSNQTGAFLLAGVTAFLFYLSILLHELGHAVVARRNRIGIVGIDLWMFGGIASMDRDAGSPGAEFRIAAAGPLVTVLIAAVCIAIGVAAYGSQAFFDGFVFVGEGESDALAVLTSIAFINVALLAFNLVPAFPLDGGRIARSIAWKLTGDRTRGTRIAAAMGQGFSVILIGLGIFTVVATGDIFGGLWFVLIGWFIGDAARTANYQTAVLSKIEGVKVADVMDSEPVAIPGDMTIHRALDEFILRYRYPWFPVTDSYDRFIGVVDSDRAQHVPEEKQKVFKVNEVMRAEGDQLRVRSDDPLEALLSNEPLRRLGALMAVDRDGRLTGVVTIEQISRALQHGVAP